MVRVLAGLFAVVVGGVSALLAAPAGAASHDRDRVVEARAYADIMRPIPVATPTTRGAEIATAAPATVDLVRSRRQRHRRPRRHQRDRAALSVQGVGLV